MSVEKKMLFATCARVFAMSSERVTDVFSFILPLYSTDRRDG
jgi:hypothetical protein